MRRNAAITTPFPGGIPYFFESAFGGYPAGVLYPILMIVIWWAILEWMDRRRIDIKP